MKKKKKVTNYPKVSIITCVYNGEEYISKLLESVLNMGYPNIEHIIVNDGSTDSTEEIVMKYVELYKNKEDSNLYIKYIKQDNMGLGGATNTGLKRITGEYWTWINCDDWYAPQAFIKPIRMLSAKKKLDYVQMNGFHYNPINGKQRKALVNTKRMRCNNKYKLFIDFCYVENFKYLLFICRTASYKKICPSMQIYASKYTQDTQFASQIFGTLNGVLYNRICYFYLTRSNSYCNIIRKSLIEDIENIRKCSINYLKISDSDKRTLLLLFQEEELLRQLKYSSIKHSVDKAHQYYVEIKNIRNGISKKYKRYLDKKVFLYYLYSHISFFKHRQHIKHE